MKRLAIFCFCLLFSVLSALSIKPQTNSPYSELRALFKEVGIDAYTLGLRSVAENYDNVITQQLYMLRIYGAQTVFC